MDFLQSKKIYHEKFPNNNFRFFSHIFSVKNQTDNDEGGSRSAVTVVGLQHRMFVSRSGSDFAVFSGKICFVLGVHLLKCEANIVLVV